MHRIIVDGTDEYAVLVDEADWPGGRAGAAPAPGVTAGTGEPTGRMPGDDSLEFGDEAECVMFLKRVADDYSERLALREVYAGYSAREDLLRLTDEALFAALAALIVGGSIKVRKV